ncbi:MFS transporter [Amycolatopsis sp. VC5-11]|uniref:MFS transporter n=1 Tax=Amycolatopsis sp. VC5-11 TaxID=3120156 RepID=UPI00300BB949
MTSRPAKATPVRIRTAATAASIGTFVEYYDFVVYAYFASVFGPLFFPAKSAPASLLLTFAAFATSYLVRPLGAMIFGPLGDRYGRRSVLSGVILLMSAATTLIGFLPAYGQIGVAAPILLTVIRLVQGISVGGEFGGAISYVAEFAPARRRGFLLSWLGVAIGLGLLAGALVSAAVSRSVSPDALASWGWRVPFLLALPLGLVGVYLRLRLADTPEFVAAAREGGVENAPLRASVRRDFRAIALTVAILAGLTVFTYLYLIYLPTYLVSVLHYGRSAALLANVVGIAAFCVGMPLFAALSDRFGRRPVLIAGSGALTALSYPGFLLLGSGRTATLGWTLAVLGLLTAATFAPCLPILPELFAVGTRYTSMGLGWNICAVLFGGAAPLVATSLIVTTGDPAAPAYYAMLGGALSLAAALAIKETAGNRLARAANQAVEPDSRVPAGNPAAAPE